MSFGLGTPGQGGQRRRLCGALALLLGTLFASEARAQSEEDDKSFFRVHMTYTFDDAPGLSQSSFFRTYVRMRDLFFLDSNDIEFDIQFHSPFELQVALSKWSLLDYHLAVGLQFGYLLGTNVDAESIEGGSFYLKDFAGNRFGGDLVVRLALAPGLSASASYGLELNRYRRKGGTPADFVLPQNNYGHNVRAAFRSHRRWTKTLDWIADAQFAFVDRSAAARYGVGEALAQLSSGRAGILRGYLDYRGRWLSALGGLSLLYGSSGAIRLGTPLVLRDLYEDVLYGFSERTVPLKMGLLQRGALRSAPLFGILAGQLQYAFLVNTDRQSTGAHLQQGWGAGLEVPVPIPYLGLYYLSVAYQQAHTNLESGGFDLRHPDSFQVLATLHTFGAW